MDLSTELFARIQETAEVKITELDGKKYADKRLFEIFPPHPKTIKISTLTGIADFIKESGDVEVSNLVCVVDNYNQVTLRSKIETEFQTRSTYLQSDLQEVDLRLNQYIDAETMNIMLQSGFSSSKTKDGENDTDKELLLSYTAKLSATAENGVEDDGITQSAIAKTGIVSKSQITLKNPVELRPYRTFTEVEQPKSKFIFRTKQEGGQIYFGLFEADGGAWKNEATLLIRDFLKSQTPKLTVIA